MIKVFHIPSWYPSNINSQFGIFNKNLIDAFSQNSSFEINYILLWNKKKYLQSPRDILFFLKSLFSIFKLNTAYSFNKKSNNQIEISIEMVELYPRFPEFLIKYYYKKVTQKILINLIKNENVKFDIIQCYSAYPSALLGYNLSKHYEIPYLITEHMSPFPFNPFRVLFSKNKMRIIKDLYLNANTIIAVSNSQKMSIIEYLNNIKVDVIPNVVNTDVFIPKNDTCPVFTIITISNLSKQKGIDTLLKAIYYFQENFKCKFKLIIVGGSEKKIRKYKSLSYKLGICNSNISFIGNLNPEDIPKKIRNSSVFLLTSIHESFGVVLIEALSSGIPVISSNCGGPADFVNSNNGVLFPVNDHIAAADALNYVYHKNYNQNLIREFAISKFSYTIISNKYYSLYSKILKNEQN